METIVPAQQVPDAGCPVGAAVPDLVDPRWYTKGDAHAEWRRLRESDRLTWHQVDRNRGYWSVTRYREADQVLRNTAWFTSERGTMLDILGIDDPAGGQQLAVTDPPRHTIMQAHLKKALTVRAVDRQREAIRYLVRKLLLPLADGAIFDFGQAMLAMPMSVTGTMMGIPEADWPWLTRLTTVCIAPGDPDYHVDGGPDTGLVLAHRALFAYFQDLVDHRRRKLGSDLVSVLITTRFDGRYMTPSEIVANCYSLLLGANVTTPHAPSFLLAEFVETGVLADWAAHPEVGATAVEEALRWASPVNHLLRYATRDVVIRSTPISAGDAVVVWVGSANRDDTVFPNASTLDIRRRPNKHLAFGIGPHYCVGHNVARLSVGVLFEELLGTFEDFRPAGKPERLISNFVAGYKRVPITARRRRDAGGTR
jgi:cytochrome P450